MRLPVLLIAVLALGESVQHRGAIQAQSAPAPADPAIVATEFIYETAPFPSAHASTIAEGSNGLVAAWFGGTAERNPDVGIWVSSRAGGRWSAPVEVATGVQPDGVRLPCWNPVLVPLPDRSLALYYKVGPSPQTWWGADVHRRRPHVV